MLNTMARVDGSIISKDIDPLHPTIIKGTLAPLKFTRNTKIGNLNSNQRKDGILSTHGPLSLTKIIASFLTTTAIPIHHTWTLSGID
jgi:hypothetical protein